MMDFRHLLFKVTVIYTLGGHSAEAKRSRAFFVPVIEESDLPPLGENELSAEVSKRRKNQTLDWSEDDFDEHLRRFLADFTSTLEPDDLVGSKAGKKKRRTTRRPSRPASRPTSQPTSQPPSSLPSPKPSCFTYPRKSNFLYIQPRKSEIRKRSRCKLSPTIRDPGTRDILNQLNDEIEEQEMDKRSRIELLSYLDAAIKNKNIELNLELAHLAKEEEMFNIKNQDNLESEKSVLALRSNIDELGKKIKDLDERIVQMRKLKEERANQENAIWRDTFEKSASYNLGGVKIGDNDNHAQVDSKSIIGVPVASNVKAAVPNIVVGAPNMIASAPNLLVGAPHVLPGAPQVIPGLPNVIAGAPHIAGALTISPDTQASNVEAAPAVISSMMSGRYLGPNALSALPETISAGASAAQAGSWWPTWATQQWNGMYQPQWPQLQDYKRLPPLYAFLPHQRSVSSDLVEEYDD